ncbi:MAG: exosome protein [Methanomassiliicoccaceae archaeon]|jgi:RNA binding exosome subunit|nr:exosome protein [Methanomassiliicoccaceae archaeon]
MASVFHWVRIKLFCYATEDEEKLHDLMCRIAGTDDFDAEMSDGHHGNSMIIFTAELKKDAECAGLFGRFGKEVIDDVLNGLDNRIDDDCVFHLRLDKQAAVQERYEIAHHGDVVSVTCKIASHPARKVIASSNMKRFLEDLRTSF